MAADSNFGERMRQLREERGGGWGGRRPIAEKYKRHIAATERIFASALADEAERYIDELAPKEGERCEIHGAILTCPAKGCEVQSTRTTYDHKAAQYVFDRMMGKPTTRSENSVTVRLVEQWTAQIAVVFLEVNDIDDPLARREAFAERCDALASLYAGNAGAA